MVRVFLITITAFVFSLGCSGPDETPPGTDLDLGMDMEEDGIEASCEDGVQNQGETDVDCGGPCAPCGDGLRCQLGTDCQSSSCVEGVCQPASPASCDDGVVNGNETDIDCGGPDCEPCGAGQMCAQGEDCQSLICDGGVCSAAMCGDGVVNQVFEVCDEGDDNDDDGNCSADCRRRMCVVGRHVESIGDALADPGCMGVILGDGEYVAGVAVARAFRIEGQGPESRIVPPADMSRSVLEVAAARLSISNVTISGGDADLGGGIRSVDGEIYLTDVTLTANRATQSGAGIHLQGGALRGERVTVEENIVEGAFSARGAGIYVRDGALNLFESTVRQNTATSQGGSGGAGIEVFRSLLRLEDTEVKDNLARGATLEGGGVVAAESQVEMLRVDLSDNRLEVQEGDVGLSVRGGGASLRSSQAELEEVRVERNRAVVDRDVAVTFSSAAGGGINLFDSDLQLRRTQIVQNEVVFMAAQADGVVSSGGGLFVSQSQVMAVESSVENNTVEVENAGALAIAGGGGFALGFAVDLLLRESLVADNQVVHETARGGAFFSALHDDRSSTVVVVNSTISSNEAGEGSLIWVGNLDDTGAMNVVLRYATIFAPTGGTSIFGTDAIQGSLTLSSHGSILEQEDVADPCDGLSFESEGHNLMPVGCLANPEISDITGQSAQLEALADNGGPTRTHAPGANSPVIDAGAPICTDHAGVALATDQRLVMRGAVCDMGAYESP